MSTTRTEHPRSDLSLSQHEWNRIEWTNNSVETYYPGQRLENLTGMQGFHDFHEWIKNHIDVLKEDIRLSRTFPHDWNKDGVESKRVAIIGLVELYNGPIAYTNERAQNVTEFQLVWMDYQGNNIYNCIPFGNPPVPLGSADSFVVKDPASISRMEVITTKYMYKVKAIHMCRVSIASFFYNHEGSLHYCIDLSSLNSLNSYELAWNLYRKLGREYKLELEWYCLAFEGKYTSGYQLLQQPITFKAKLIKCHRDNWTDICTSYVEYSRQGTVDKNMFNLEKYEGNCDLGEFPRLAPLGDTQASAGIGMSIPEMMKIAAIMCDITVKDKCLDVRKKRYCTIDLTLLYNNEMLIDGYTTEV